MRLVGDAGASNVLQVSTRTAGSPVAASYRRRFPWTH